MRLKYKCYLIKEFDHLRKGLTVTNKEYVFFAKKVSHKGQTPHSKSVSRVSCTNLALYLVLRGLTFYFDTPPFY